MQNTYNQQSKQYKKQQQNQQPQNTQQQLTYLYQLSSNKIFSNPICKQTYNSLSKIYGKKKKKIKLHTLHQKSSLSKINNSKNIQPLTKINQQKNIQQQMLNKQKYSIQLSQKSNTFYHHSMNKTSKNNTTSHNKSLNHINSVRNISKSKSKHLPQKPHKFQLKQLQSQHKVALQNIISKTFYPIIKTQLQNIITTQNKKNVNKFIIKNQYQRKKYSFTHMRHSSTKQQQLNNINHDFDQNSSSQNKTKQQKQDNSISVVRKHSQRYQKNNDTHDQSSLSLNQLVLKKTQLKNVKFHFRSVFKNCQEKLQKIYNSQHHYHNVNNSQKQLNLSVKDNQNNQTSQKIEKNKTHDQSQKSQKNEKIKNLKPYSPLPTQLFVIPQQPQYHNFIKTYKSINPNFNIKSIIKSPLFRILKQQQSVYFGQIDSQQKKHGQGINVAPLQIYQGQYSSGFKCYGYQKTIDGVYAGGYQNGLRSGYGTFKWYNGQTYQGNWQSGMKNGFGIWKSPQNDSYQGNWLLNRQHGKGIFKYKDSKYTGQFKKSIKNGHGQQIFLNGDRYNGQYQNGKQHGIGRYDWSQGGYYQGQFVKGVRQGKGTYVDVIGNIYQGYFKQDFKHGNGIQTYISGDKFEGQFDKGSRRKGKLYNKSLNWIETIGKQ